LAQSEFERFIGYAGRPNYLLPRDVNPAWFSSNSNISCFWFYGNRGADEPFNVPLSITPVNGTTTAATVAANYVAAATWSVQIWFFDETVNLWTQATSPANASGTGKMTVNVTSPIQQYGYVQVISVAGGADRLVCEIDAQIMSSTGSNP
jgi:hypothetical protein